MNPTNLLFNIFKTISAYTPIKFAPGNPNGVKSESFVLGNARGEAKNPKIGTPANFPKVILQSKGGSEGQGAPKPFGLGKAGSIDVDYVVPTICQCVLTIVHRDTIWDTQSDLEAAVDQFLESVRHMILGLTIGVVTYTWTTIRTEAERSVVTGMELRSVTRRTISVNCRPYRSLLLQSETDTFFIVSVSRNVANTIFTFTFSQPVSDLPGDALTALIITEGIDRRDPDSIVGEGTTTLTITFDTPVSGATGWLANADGIKGPDDAALVAPFAGSF